MIELDGLPLEYKRDYGIARGNLDISDFVNNPFVNCELSIFSLGLSEKFSYFIQGDIRMLDEDIANSLLVA